MNIPSYLLSDIPWILSVHSLRLSTEDSHQTSSGLLSLDLLSKKKDKRRSVPSILGLDIICRDKLSGMNMTLRCFLFWFAYSLEEVGLSLPLDVARGTIRSVAHVTLPPIPNKAAKFKNDDDRGKILKQQQPSIVSEYIMAYAKSEFIESSIWSWKTVIWTENCALAPMICLIEAYHPDQGEPPSPISK